MVVTNGAIGRFGAGTESMASSPLKGDIEVTPEQIAVLAAGVSFGEVIDVRGVRVLPAARKAGSRCPNAAAVARSAGDVSRGQ